MLKAAEGLMSQVKPCNYVALTTKIIEAYLDVDIVKSKQLLDAYTYGQATNHLVTAVIPPVALAVLHAYPLAGMVCSAASLVIREIYRF